MSPPRHTRRLVQLKKLFKEYGIHPMPRRGQNFLLDRNQVSYIARLGDLGPDDIVLEVGPGTGFLSREILAYGCRLLCVELDRKLAEVVRNEFGELPAFELIEADVLAGKNVINPDVLARLAGLIREHGGKPRLKSISNLPYSAGTPFAMNMFHSTLPWERAVFLLQLEVVKKMVAKPGDTNYGALSITCALGGTASLVRTVPPQVFWPRPRVGSAVVTIDFNSPEERAEIPWKALRRVTSATFSSRRKRLRNSLKGLFPKETLDATLTELDIDPNRRGETLAPAIFLDLARRLPPTP